MHPLLSPTTHADLRIAADSLASSMYSAIEPDTLYTRMLLGTTMGLTIFESALGVTVLDGRTVVEKVLIERVLFRNEVKVTTVNLDEKIGCQLEFNRSGRKLGVVVLETKDVPSVNVLYDFALMRGVRAYLTDVFPHKIYLKSELPAPSPASAEHPLLPKVQEQMKHISRIPVVTADKLSVPKHPHKLALAKDSQTLLDWQSKNKTLSIENPAEWDFQLGLLNGFAFLTDAQKDDQFKELLELGAAYGVAYDDNTAHFYLAEVPAFTE